MHNDKVLLVGDNPFHGVSHLSQDRARERNQEITNPQYCANLIKLSLENGADGFMFSVSETTIAILKILIQSGEMPKLYAIAPAASDYVRLASRMGTPGLAVYLARQIAVSGNYRAITNGFKGVICQNPISLMKAYIFYELYRIKSATTRSMNPYCFLLHEIVTEMALALNLEWLFKAYIDFLRGLKIKPGFETRNSPRLIDSLMKWGVDLKQIVIVAPFNKVGFQMSPSREECEKALLNVPDTEVIAMSVLASGYIKLPKAIGYINGIPQLKGIVVGVSKEQHARDFKTFKETLVNK
jgi:hypothetical protein